MLKAARLGDQISHTQQRSGLIGGMLLGAALVVGAILVVGTGGLAAPLLIGAVATGAAVGGGLGRLWGSTKTVPKGNINKAATTVFINSRGTPAARACTDTALCDDHTLKLIATGSTTVVIEGFPAARVSDMGACSFKISQGSDNVFIGGETAQCAGVEITPEVEGWLENLHLTLGLVGAFCLALPSAGILGAGMITALGFGGSLLGSKIGGHYFGKWGAIGGGVLGGILGGGFGVGLTRGLGRAGTRGFQPFTGLRQPSSLVATKPNEAFFWSGKTNGVGGQKVAQEIARANKGTTLETLIEQRGIKMPDWDPANPASIRAWENLSAEYASNASGHVRAVLGKDLRPGNVWENIELPALRNNPNVTKITTIDPATRAETIIFTR